jgi:LVIVD repeat
MRRAAWCRTFLAIAAVTLVMPATATAPPKEKTGSLTQVGHEPLMSRGMNSAGAIHGDYMYIGSRTDGGHEGMPHGGIMIVDISDPSEPTLVTDEPIDATPGESSRELRVWASQNILIVLNTNCGVGDQLHHCTLPSISNFRFYDISGANATDPQLLFQFNADTHEFFLWQDPNNPERALIFAGNAASTCAIRGGSPSCPFSVWDISPVRNGQSPVTLFNGLHGYTRFPAFPEPAQKPTGSLHSLSVSNDGSRAYFALLTGGFAVVDVSDFANGVPSPQPRPITLNEARPTWSGPGAHSAGQALGP